MGAEKCCCLIAHQVSKRLDHYDDLVLESLHLIEVEVEVRGMEKCYYQVSQRHEHL